MRSINNFFLYVYNKSNVIFSSIFIINCVYTIQITINSNYKYLRAVFTWRFKNASKNYFYLRAFGVDLEFWIFNFRSLYLSQLRHDRLTDDIVQAQEQYWIDFASKLICHRFRWCLNVQKVNLNLTVNSAYNFCPNKDRKPIRSFKND